VAVFARLDLRCDALGKEKREKEASMSCKLRTILALTTAVLAIGALAPVASAWPGRNGAIVFETDIPGGEEEASRGTGLRIAALGADRDEVGILTEDPGDRQPQVSPDGSLVVFARLSNPSESSRDQPTTIFVIRTDGTGLRPLTDGTRNDREPAFGETGLLCRECRREHRHLLRRSRRRGPAPDDFGQLR
jgi:hypothetical protein